jgi:hypothetical protein
LLTERQLADRFSKAEALGEPSRMDLVFSADDSDRNADVPLRRAAAMAQGFITRIENRTNTVLVWYLPQEVVDLRNSDPEFDALLDKALGCSEYRPKYDLGPESQAEVNQFDALIRVEAAHAEALLRQGRTEQSIQAALRMLKLGRLIMRGPSLKHSLKGAGMGNTALWQLNRTLRAKPPSTATRQRIEEGVALEEHVVASLAYPVQCERLMRTTRFLEVLAAPSDRRQPALESWWLAFLLNENRIKFYEYATEFSATLAEPFGDAKAHWEKVVQTTNRPDVTFVLRSCVRAADPSFWIYRVGAERHRALSRCIRVLNATLASPGKRPKLEELNLPAEATLDPFTSQPLHLRWDDDGVTVYSGGEDLRDDGGKHREPYGRMFFWDIGIAPPKPASFK